MAFYNLKIALTGFCIFPNYPLLWILLGLYVLRAPTSQICPSATLLLAIVNLSIYKIWGWDGLQ
jgi:hypothetical protein